MTHLEKIEQAVKSPAYQAYCHLMGTAIYRAAMGDPTARAEIFELQREQERLVRDAMEAP